MSRRTRQKAAFREAAECLDRSGVAWWLSDGAALGCVRDGGFVATDPDIDLGFWQSDEPAVLAAFDGWQPDRKRVDVKMVRYGVKVDLHGHVRDGDRVWFPLANGSLRYTFPARLFDRFEPATFYGRTVALPSPSVDYLVAHYGDGWETPRGGWRWDVDPPCLTIPG
jgi:hypothetical protein